MKTKTLLFIVILVISNNLFAQASWGFSVWFNLKDKNGKVIDANTYKKEGIKLLSAPIGVHNGNYFTYDTIAKAFRFSQHTAVTNSILVFIHKKDTTIININTKNLYISELRLSNNIYDLRIWGFENGFDCHKKLPGYKHLFVCENKKVISSYVTIVDESTNYNELVKSLIEVKLE